MRELRVLRPGHAKHTKRYTADLARFRHYRVVLAGVAKCQCSHTVNFNSHPLLFIYLLIYLAQTSRQKHHPSLVSNNPRTAVLIDSIQTQTKAFPSVDYKSQSR